MGPEDITGKSLQAILMQSQDGEPLTWMHWDGIKSSETFHTFLITLVLCSPNPQQNKNRLKGAMEYNVKWPHRYNNVKVNSMSLRNETAKLL